MVSTDELPQRYLPTVRSCLSGIDWPALPDLRATHLLAIAQQFGHSQWWSPERLLQHQFRQLVPLSRFAFDHVPIYRERLAAAGYRRGQEITLAMWQRLRPLDRKTARECMSELLSVTAPPEHGGLYEDTTSGKTGIPLRVRKTALAGLFYDVQTLREELWHGRDLRRKLAVIRPVKEGPREQRSPNWGQPDAIVFRTGPAVILDFASTVEEQAEFLLRERPDYVLINVASLDALAWYFRDRGAQLEGLRDIRTFGSRVGPELREHVRKAFGVEIADVYSAVEVGYIALQCPRHSHYHVVSESTLVEVVNEAGAPCKPGEIGSVLATSLHNYAMPLLRYELGDLAEVGPPCPCGRGLPVLREIVGRQRDRLALPSGGRRHVALGNRSFAQFEQIRQFQVVQKTLRDIEVKLVVRGVLGPAEEDRIRRDLTAVFEPGMSITFTYVDAISRGAGGKLEDFVSEVKGE